MKIYKLDIKDTDKEFIITIKKNQLNSEYILNLVNWLQFASLEPIELNNYFQSFKYTLTDKKKEILSKKRVWNFAGSVNLNKSLDNTNLRDLAYD